MVRLKYRLPTIAIGGAIALLLSIPADAATVSKLVTFSASSITAFLNGPVPVDPVTGSFDITFDPTQNYTDAAGITSPSINVPVDYSWVFNYDSTTGDLTVGGDYGSAERLWAARHQRRLRSNFAADQ